MDISGPRPLSSLPAGQEAVVVALAGGRAMQGRLASMGLHVGCSLEVVRSSNGVGGPTLIALGSTRLAVGRGMAERILVSPARR
jgi:Fe2+ transport system protein FeoA